MKMIKSLILWFLRQDLVFRMIEVLSWQQYRGQVERLARENRLFIQLGSGRELLEGWINADGRVGRGILSMYFPRGLKRFRDNSAELIYSSHFLEHLEYPEPAGFFLKECFRILKPGGKIRIVVPGIEKIIRAYVDNNREFFEIQASMHPSWCRSRLDHLMYALQMEGRHKYGYDYETMKNLMEDAGFIDVLDSDNNTSPTEAFRIDYRGAQDEKGNYLSLYVEATKPA